MQLSIQILRLNVYVKEVHSVIRVDIFVLTMVETDHC